MNCRLNPITFALASALSAPVFATELAPVEVEGTAIESAQVSNTETDSLNQAGNSETGTALRSINGVEGSRMGGHGVDLFIRGQGQSQLNILLDGAKIEGGCPNRMDPPTAYAEINSYDEVIVTKGVNTVTTGTGGSGGTVEFVRTTPQYDPNKTLSGSITAATASNGINHDITAEVQAVGEQGYLVLQGNTKSADNYTDGNGNDVASSYESRQGHIDLGWTPNDHHELKLSLEQTITEDALFQGSMMDAPESDGRTTRLQYNAKNLGGAVTDVEVELYQSEVDHVMNNFQLRPAGDPTKLMETPTNVETSGGKVQLSSMVGHTELKYGIQTESVDKVATLYNRKPEPDMRASLMWPQVESTTDSAFVEATSFFKDSQKVILGLRYDDFTSEAKMANTKPNMMGMTPAQLYSSIYNDVAVTDISNDSQNLNGLVRYEKGLANNMNVYAGLSRTHRYPDATELFMAKTGMDSTGDGIVDGSWVGNPNLEPEQHNQLDFGISQASQKFAWSASAYYDKVDNYILRDLSQNQTNTAGMKNTVYLNKDAVIFGLDLEGQMQVSNTVRIGGSLSKVHGENTTDDRNLSNIAPVNGNIFAEYSAHNMLAGARFNYALEQEHVNTEFGELTTAAYNTLDLYGQMELSSSMSLMAGVDNLFDRGYQSYLNRTDFMNGNTYKVYEPGRIVWARINAQF